MASLALYASKVVQNVFKIQRKLIKGYSWSSPYSVRFERRMSTIPVVTNNSTKRGRGSRHREEGNGKRNINIGC